MINLVSFVFLGLLGVLHARTVIFEDFGELLCLDGRQLFRVQFVQVDLRLTADLVVRGIAVRTQRQVSRVSTHLPESSTDRGFKQRAIPGLLANESGEVELLVDVLLRLVGQSVTGCFACSTSTLAA